jgi:hypothetical protein
MSDRVHTLSGGLSIQASKAVAMLSKGRKRFDLEAVITC